jgi:3-dehydroquinate synthetase
LPAAEDLDAVSIINAISRDKKSVRGAVQWVLLERIGRPRIVSSKEIDRASLKASIRDALQKRTYE